MSLRSTLNPTQVGLVAARRQLVAVVFLATAAYWASPYISPNTSGRNELHSIQLWLPFAGMLIGLAVAATTAKFLSETAAEMRRVAIQRDGRLTKRVLTELAVALTLAAACVITGLFPHNFKLTIISSDEVEHFLSATWAAIASIGLAFFAANARAAFIALS